MDNDFEELKKFIEIEKNKNTRLVNEIRSIKDELSDSKKVCSVPEKTVGENSGI